MSRIDELEKRVAVLEEEVEASDTSAILRLYALVREELGVGDNDLDARVRERIVRRAEGRKLPAGTNGMRRGG